MVRVWSAGLQHLDDHAAPWLVVLAALLALQISPWWFPTPDSAAYLSMARSLASAGTLLRFGSPHLYFSPGYPVLISPLFLLGPRPLFAISVCQWVLAVALMLGVYRWTRRSWPGAAVLLTAFVMVNTSVWLYLRRPVSEIAFMAALIWAANLLNAVPASVHAGRWGRGAAGAVLLTVVALLRPAGVLFAAGFAAMMMVQAWRGKVRWAVAAALAVLVCTPPIVAVREVMARDRVAQAATASSKPTYFRQLLETRGDLARQISRGAYLQVLNVGRLLVPGMLKAHSKGRQWADPNLLLYLPLALAVLAGWGRRVRGAPDLLMCGLPLYVGLYVLWPFDEDTRFLLPVLPALVGCAWTVLGRFRQAPAILAVLVVGHVAAATVFWLKELPGVRACDAQWPAVDALAAALPEEAEGVAAVGVRDCMAGMLTVARDRQVRFVSGAEVPDDVRWVVHSRAGGMPAGFEVVRTVDGYVVAKRGATPAAAMR